MNRNTAIFQDKLLEILEKESNPKKIKEYLLQNEDLKYYSSYIESFNLSMLGVAAELVKKWGHRVKLTTPSRK